MKEKEKERGRGRGEERQTDRLREREGGERERVEGVTQFREQTAASRESDPHGSLRKHQQKQKQNFNFRLDLSQVCKQISEILCLNEIFLCCTFYWISDNRIRHLLLSFLSFSLYLSNTQKQPVNVIGVNCILTDSNSS